MDTLPLMSLVQAWCLGPGWRPWPRTLSWLTPDSLMEISQRFPPWLWLWEWALSWMPKRWVCLFGPYFCKISSSVYVHFTLQSYRTKCSCSATLCFSSQVMILITGAHKAFALYKAIEEGVNHMWTVSAFQQHRQTLFVCDEDATLELRVKTVKYFKGETESMQLLTWAKYLYNRPELLKQNKLLFSQGWCMCTTNWWSNYPRSWRTTKEIMRQSQTSTF